MLIGIIQISATSDYKYNFDKVCGYVIKMTDCELIVLPEVFLYRGDNRKIKEVYNFYRKKVYPYLLDFSKKNNLCLIAGTLLIPFYRKFKNTAEVLYKGDKIANYTKIHLFKIDSGEKKINEGEYLSSGKRPVVFKFNDWLIGLGICFDLRFPELFRYYAKKRVDIIVIPSNFLYKTGKKHWTVLLRARAIENQCFVIAANQCGIHPYLKIPAYGHSMVIGPDGEIVDEIRNREGIIKVDISKKQIIESRTQLCSLPRGLSRNSG
ncbi:MAG: nitrilase-related carbon-nitrogen hydrolase [Candidatus Hydrogenedentota bacterium]